MREFLLVFIGGGLGSVLRFIFNRLIPVGSFPYSTLTVNMVGSFLIGIIIGYLISNNMLKSDYYYFLIIGICELKLYWFKKFERWNFGIR